MARSAQSLNDFEDPISRDIAMTKIFSSEGYYCSRMLKLLVNAGELGRSAAFRSWRRTRGRRWRSTAIKAPSTTLSLVLSFSVPAFRHIASFGRKLVQMRSHFRTEINERHDRCDQAHGDSSLSNLR